MKPWWQLCLAKGIGTFALVFMGAAMNPARYPLIRGGMGSR